MPAKLSRALRPRARQPQGAERRRGCRDRGRPRAPPQADGGGGRVSRRERKSFTEKSDGCGSSSAALPTGSASWPSSTETSSTPTPSTPNGSRSATAPSRRRSRCLRSAGGSSTREQELDEHQIRQTARLASCAASSSSASGARRAPGTARAPRAGAERLRRPAPARDGLTPASSVEASCAGAIPYVSNIEPPGCPARSR